MMKALASVARVKRSVSTRFNNFAPGPNLWELMINGYP